MTDDDAVDQRDVIEQLVRQAVAETGGREGLVIGEYILIAATNGWDDNGEDVSQVVTIPEGSGSRVLGLVEWVRAELKQDITSGEDW